MSVSATCDTIRKFRKCALERLVDFPRPALCRSFCNWRCDELSAGTSPRSNPANRETAEGKHQHSRVHSDPADLRQVAVVRADDEIDAPEREQNSEHARDKREQNCFRNELAREPPARSAQRGAHRHFLAPSCCADEKQVRHVRAGDHEKHADRAADDEEDAANIFHQPFSQWIDAEAGRVRLRAVLNLQLAADRGDLGARLFKGNARLQPASHAPVMRSPRWDRREELGREPNIDVGREFRLRGQHADYREAAIGETKSGAVEILCVRRDTVSKNRN